MAGGSLGTVYGTVRMDVSAALASYALLARASQATTTAMVTGSAAVLAASKGFTAVGLALGAGVAYAVNAAADFEKQLDFFGAVSNSTAEQMELVREKALELGQDTRYSAGQIADSFIDLGKAGVSAEDIIGGVADAVVALGAAADIPLSQAANIITAAIQTFELGAGDATHVADLLAGAANASILDVEDLGVSLKYVGGVANAISIPIDQVIDAISLLGKAGIKGSTAGTSLRQILVSLSGTSKKAQKQLMQLGIITEDGKNKFFDAEGKAKSLGEIFQVLGDATAHLTEEQRLSAFKIIFNNRALSAAAILSREGAAGFAEMSDEISKTTAADVASKRLDNLNGDILKLKGALTTLFIEAGGPFQQFLRDIVQSLTSLVRAFNNLDPSTQALIFKILAIGSAFFLTVGATLLVVGTITRLWAMTRRIVPLLGLMARIVVILTRGLWALSVALATTPIGWIILALAALTAAFILLWNRSEAFRNFWKGLGQTLIEVGKSILEFFMAVPGFFVAMWETITQAFFAGVDGVQRLWSGFVNLLSTGWNATVDGIVTAGIKIRDFFVSLPGWILEGLTTAFPAILNFLTELPEHILYALGFAIGRTILWGSQLATVMWDIGLKATEALLNFFLALPGNIWNILKSIDGFIKDGLQGMLNLMVEYGPKIFNAIIDFFKGMPPAVGGALKTAGEEILWALAVWIANATELGSKAAGALLGWFAAMPGAVWEWLRQTAGQISTFVLSFLIRAGELGMNAVNGIMDWLKKLPGLVWELLQEVVKQFGNMVKSAWEKAKDLGSALWNGFKHGLDIRSPSNIEKAVFQINDTFRTEMRTIRGHVGTIQALSRQVNRMNPALSLSTTNAAAFRAGIQAMTSQLQQAESINSMLQANRDAATVGFNGSITRNRSALGSSLDDAGSSLVVNMNVFNPTAEPASSTAARKLRTLSEMGVLK